MIFSAILLATAQPAQAEARPDPTGQALIACAPQTYDAAIACLQLHLPAADQEVLRRDGAAAAHFGLGMWMRNNWGLWGGGPLKAAMQARGVSHPDDMSGAILDGFVDRLRETSTHPAPLRQPQRQN